MKTISDFSTYRTAVLQTRASRNLRNFKIVTLKKHNLSAAEWSIIGVASEETKNGGIRVSDLAKMLDVETSFVTNMVKRLIKNGYLAYEYDLDDGRVRLVVATDKCHLKVIEIERYLRKEMREWLSDVNHEELLVYIKVLEQISNKSIQFP